MHLTSAAPQGLRSAHARLPRYAAMAIGSAALFGLLLLLIREDWGPLARLDSGWTDSLHDFARGHTAWTAALQTLTTLGGPIAMRTILGLTAGWLWAIGARALAGWAAAQAVLGWAVEWAAKTAVDRARPHFLDPVAQAAGPAFPSGHAMTAAIASGALAALVWPQAARAGRVAACSLAALTTLAVSFTRIALGVHWPSDVLGGWLLAAAVLGGSTAAIELWHPGALARDVRRVNWRTRPRVQSVLASAVPFPELPQQGEFDARRLDER